METTDRAPQLWRLARQRAKFKSGLVIYLLVNTGLWALWYFTDRQSNPIPWPLWVSFFWGIGVVASGLRAYGNFGFNLSEREYEKLLRQQRNELR